MQNAILPVFLFIICVLGLAIGLMVVSGLLNPGRPNRVTRMPYESGMDPIHDTRRRFDVRFHLLAIAFLIFDVELLFLYPWAVAVRGEGQAAVEAASGQWSVASDRWTVDQHSPKPLAVSRSQISNLKSQISSSSSPAPVSGIDAAVAAGVVESRHLVFGGAMTFLLLVTLGFVYDWRKGIFRWR